MDNRVFTKETEKFGTFRSDRYPSKEKRKIIFGIVLFFSFFAFAVVLSISLLGIEDIEFGFGGVLFVTGIASVFLGFGIYNVHLLKKLDREYSEFLREVKEKKKKEAEKERIFKQNHPHYQEEKFYKECKKNKIDNVKEKANIARLSLIAEKCGITASVEELINMYTVGKEDVKSAEREVKIEKEKKAEQKLLKASKKYIKFFGRDKKIKMLQDEATPYRKKLTECRKKQAALRGSADSLYEASKGREQDWALHGGIASGIAGGAAGLATAIDIQNKNAQIRANNEELLRNATILEFELGMQLSKNESDIEEEIKYYEDIISKTELKLVEELDQNYLLELLKPKATIKKSITGAVLITVETDSTPKLKIYDSVNAVVDGTIKVNLLSDGVKIDEAYATLPINGSTFQNTIETICASTEGSTANYTVSFEPHKLWAIEK